MNDFILHSAGEIETTALVPFLPRSTAWYLKPQATFSDCLARMRRTILAEGNDVNSLADQDQVVISRPAWEHVLAQLAAIA